MQRKWLVAIGVVAAVTVALALGVSPGTLLLVGAVLLCPAAMFFGMGAMGHGSGHGKECKHADAQEGAERKPEGNSFKTAA